MERYEIDAPETNENEIETPSNPFLKAQPKIIKSGKYKINYKEDIYSLLIEIYSDDNIYFNLKKFNNLSLYQYTNTFSYNHITKLFLLPKDYYNNMTKIFNFIDTSITKKKLSIDYINDKNPMILKLKKLLDFDEIECKLELHKNKIPQDEMFCLLIEQINDIKYNKNDNNENNHKINELNNKIQKYEDRINQLEDKIKELEKEINQFKQNEEKIINPPQKIEYFYNKKIIQKNETQFNYGLVIYLKEDKIIAYNEKYGLFTLPLNDENLKRIPDKSRYVNLGQSVLLTGGMSKENKPSTECYLISLIENDHSIKPNYSTNISLYGDLNDKRERHNLIFLPNKNCIFACGGFFCKSCEYSDLYKGNWELISPLNKSRGNASMSYVNDRFIYIMGGFELKYNDPNGCYLNDIEYFDINNFENGWKLINFENPHKYNLYLSAFGVVPISKSIFLICGGFDGKEYKNNVYTVDCTNYQCPLIEEKIININSTIFTHNNFCQINKSFFNFDFLGQIYKFDHENWRFEIIEMNQYEK